MNTKRLLCISLAMLLTGLNGARAQGTLFTYQGRLTDGGNPANDLYDLRFTLYDSAAAGAALGGPIPLAAVAASNGLFTVRLDFGADVFNGAERWLEIAARANGSAGAFTVLTPRQRITPTPYAIRAANFSGTINSAQLPANIARLDANQTFSGAVILSNANNIIAGDGSRLKGISSLDSPNGGPPDVLTLDALGRAGIGTNTSGAALHVTSMFAPFDPANLRLDGLITNGLTPGLSNFLGLINVFVDGGRAYVTCFHPGALKIFDVSNPRQPRLIGEAVDSSSEPRSPFSRLGGASGVFVTNNVAYVAAEIDHTVTIIDVTDAQNLVKLAEITDDVGEFRGIDSPTTILVSGTICFVLSFTDSALSVIDVSNPARPRLIKEIFDDSVMSGSPFTKLRSPYHMTLGGTRLFIAARGDHAVTVLDIADPANPQLLAEFVDDSVDPTSPFTKLRNANWVEVAGNILYVAAGAFDLMGDHSLTLIDVSNPTSPVVLSELTDDSGRPGSPFTKLRGAWAVRVVRSTAFVTCYSDQALSVIDVSNPREPRLLRELVDGVGGVDHLALPLGLDIEGDMLYVVSQGDNALNRFNLRPLLGLVVDDPVGIGTASPRSALDVAGVVTARGLKVDEGVMVSGNLIVDGADLNRGTYEPGIIFGSNSGESIASRRGPGPGLWGLDFFTAFRPRLSIANNGNVGIGTRLPAVPLHVVGESNLVQLKVAAGSNAHFGAFLSLDARATAGGKEYLIFSTGASAGEGQGKLVFQNHTDWRNILTLDSNGSIGAGTVNPMDALLDVEGPVHINDHDIFLRGGTDRNHGLGFRASLAAQFIDGPVLYGFIGGALGTTGGGANWSLRWDMSGDVFTRGAINPASDRNLKENFSPVDGGEVLAKVAALPIAHWNYKAETQARHLGPVAQDFHAIFGLGSDDKHIATVDADGVALAAIQGLNRKVEEKEARIQALEEELTALREQVAKLAATVAER